mgnify:CR=1 FL=1
MKAVCRHHEYVFFCSFMSVAHLGTALVNSYWVGLYTALGRVMGVCYGSLMTMAVLEQHELLTPGHTCGVWAKDSPGFCGPFRYILSHMHRPCAQVYRGKWNNTNVAIVAMRKGGLVTEARLMQQLGSHPNLCQFYRCVA